MPGYSTATGASNFTAADVANPTKAEIDAGINAAIPRLSAYHGMYGTGSSEKYLTKYQRFTEPGAAGALKYQFQLNGAYYPQYPAGTEDMYQITKNSLPSAMKYNLTKQQYTDSYFVQCIRLNMPDSEFSRTISGLDTRSVSLNGYVNTTGVLTANNNLMIFAECTSSLRIGSGRQIEVVV